MLLLLMVRLRLLGLLQTLLEGGHRIIIRRVVQTQLRNRVIALMRGHGFREGSGGTRRREQDRAMRTIVVEGKSCRGQRDFGESLKVYIHAQSTQGIAMCRLESRQALQCLESNAAPLLGRPLVPARQREDNARTTESWSTARRGNARRSYTRLSVSSNTRGELCHQRQRSVSPAAL